MIRWYSLTSKSSYRHCWHCCAQRCFSPNLLEEDVHTEGQELEVSCHSSSCHATVTASVTNCSFSFCNALGLTRWPLFSTLWWRSLLNHCVGLRMRKRGSQGKQPEAWDFGSSFASSLRGCRSQHQYWSRLCFANIECCRARSDEHRGSKEKTQQTEEAPSKCHVTRIEARRPRTSTSTKELQ